MYRQSQGTAAAAASSALKVKEVVSAVAPVGAFVVVTFGIFLPSLSLSFPVA